MTNKFVIAKAIPSYDELELLKKYLDYVSKDLSKAQRRAGELYREFQTIQDIIEYKEKEKND